ncbi:hypothetical protein PF010_g21109 [Phytophthora fragariae]|uniref:Uncharacterized protein n=1 Tax=Phytophthora fragariae TaxID=53985 RepID=A0A6G0KD84_9STRA|nr:hypothetical protein PF010_g21109 [Phytophthora fragariae]
MKTEGPLEPALPARNLSSLLLLTATPQAPSHRPSLQRPTPKPSSPFKMAKLTGSSNYKASEVSRLLVLVSKHLPLGKDEWERLENERKAETRRMEEEQRRRDELATREARYLTEKAEAEERRMQQKLESEERARRDKEEARARSQELVLLISALTKKT